MIEQNHPQFTATLTTTPPHDYSGEWMMHVDGEVPGAAWRAPFEAAIEHIRQHHELDTERE